MGDSTCLLHGFSYASAIPNESKQGNPMHQLGESISFGRFMTESLSWDNKWSSFPHKKYVEEAERYAQPGSVAQKKAFFEAHYKRIAAQKAAAAAAAAALLEQQNAATNDAHKAEAEGDVDNKADDDQQRVVSEPEFDVDQKMEVVNILVSEQDVVKDSSTDVVESSKEEVNAATLLTANEILEKRTSIDKLDNNLENQERVSVSDDSGTPQMERPLLKNSDVSEDIPSVTSKKQSGLSSLKSSIRRKTWLVPSTPAKPAITTPLLKKENSVLRSTRKSNVDSTDKRPSPKSLRKLMSLIPTKEPDKDPIFASRKAESSRIAPSSSRTPKACRTPLRTPNLGATKGMSKCPVATPRSENRIRTPIAPSASGSKTAGPKWHVLSSVCSKSFTACRNKLQSPATLSTPFNLRTEERAARRKQKLEEKFNADEVQKTQVQRTLKEKAGNEFRKLSYSFCFKARPLPDFYKERETSINQVKKTPTKRPQTAVLGRSISNKKKEGNVSMPPPPPPHKTLPKNGLSKNPSKKNIVKPNKFLSTKLPERITHENKSPNIQH